MTATSIHEIHEQAGQEGLSRNTRGRIAGQSTSPFVRSLAASLEGHITLEMEITLRVGVMSAGGMSRAQIMDGLRSAGYQADELDVKMALRRLGDVANGWMAE